MPALSGQIITTIPDGTGAVAVEVTWFFNPATRALRNNPQAWTDSDGTVWPANAGALIANNRLNRQVRVKIVDQVTGDLIRRVTLPIAGRAVKAAVLAAQAPPDGPYVSADDFNGLTFDLS